VLALLLAGCGGPALNRAFHDYSTVHASVSNQQMLLNLARMSNYHPPYFMQLGLINTTFNFAATASGSFGHQRTSGSTSASGLDGVHTMITYGANLGAAASETPTFSITPLSGPQFAETILVPIQPRVFLHLLDQGEPIDQLVRMMVQSVTLVDGTGRTTSLVTDQPGEDVLVNAASCASFIRLLRLAGLLRELQQRQLIRIATTAVVTAVPSPVFEKPTLEESLKATQAGFTLKPSEHPGTYSLASVSNVTALRVEAGFEAAVRDLQDIPYYRLDSIDWPPVPGRATRSRSPLPRVTRAARLPRAPPPSISSSGAS
jgi:hypothetical protein